MNIPYAILKEQKSINKNCYEYHQLLAKKLFNSFKKYKTLKEPIQKNLNKCSKKKIYKWLFNQDIKARIKICSIYNDWFLKILNQLLTYNEFDKSIRFKPKKIYEDFYKIFNHGFDASKFDYIEYIKNPEIKYSEEDFNCFFEGIDSNKINEIKYGFYNNNTSNIESYNNDFFEKEFLKELRFFSLNSYNDTLSLSKQILDSQSKLQEYFDKFSACKIFSENIKVIKTKQNNIFNFSIPNWVKDLQFLSINQLIIICFEISISVYYQIYLIEKEIPKYDFDSKLQDLFNMKINIENYLAQESNNEKSKINSIFDLDNLIKEINSEENYKRYSEQEKIIENVYEIAFTRNKSSFFSDPNIKDQDVISEVINLKKLYYQNISQFANDIIFITAKHAFKVENILYNIIYQKLSNLISQKSLDELCMDIKETQKNKKKKRKNKKNKNEPKKENKDEIEDIKEDIKNNNKIYLNNSDEEEDEENNIFSSDINNDSESSKNIVNDNINCIEMKNLDKKGKEIKDEDEKEQVTNKKEKEEENENNKDNDILIKELLMEDEQREKMNKKKKKKNKCKKKNTFKEKNEIKIEDKKEEKNEIKENDKIINNSININENIIDINLNISKINDINKEKFKEESKNKKKHKDFFLYPVEQKNKKKNNIMINSSDSQTTKNKNNNNIITKDIIINLDYEKDLDSKSKESISQTTVSEKNENNEKKDNAPISNNNMILFESKENNIIVPGNKLNINKKNIKQEEKSKNGINNKSNKLNNENDYNKIQNINLNNPTINNYVIIHKDSLENISNFNPKNNLKDFVPQILPTFSHLMPFQQLPNFYLSENNELFEDLSKEILFHESCINNNLNELKKYRDDTYVKIKIYIENILNKNNFEINLINYGSHETGLSIESSDIDILIKFSKKENMNNICINTQQNIEEILSLLYNELNMKKEYFNILQINAIYTATVPVLKIKVNLENIIPQEIQSNIKKNYIFNFEEDILQLNFDFTFQEVDINNKDLNIPSLGIISYIKTSINIYKEIKPIILILKRYMKINKLNSSFHGGLSSYSLFLLLFSYIKYMKSIIVPKNSLGFYLYGFFEFYSNFNFGIFSINPILDYPYIILAELHECGMMLIDPITSFNVAKSTFKIDQIKSVFTKGMVIIRNIIFTKYGKDVYNSNTNKNTFLKELFKSKSGTLIFEEIIPQIQLTEKKLMRNWKNF